MKPKYDIDDKVFVIINKTIETKTPCPACTNGFVVLADGERYSCPRCYGNAYSVEYQWSYEADPNPRYITGFNFRCEKQRGEIVVDATYYWDSKLDPKHSVYLDSTGDERGDESLLFLTFEDAQKGAEEKIKEQIRQEQAEREREEKHRQEIENRRQKQKVKEIEKQILTLVVNAGAIDPDDVVANLSPIPSDTVRGVIANLVDKHKLSFTNECNLTLAKES